MKRVLLSISLALLTVVTAGAALKEGTEYYIWLNIYEKLLGLNEAGNGPALSAYGTKTDGYVFVAESSGKSGYVLLKQKSSGKYLAASSANTWSMTLESKSTDDRFCWQADEGAYVYLINKKSGKYVGIDGANKGSTYVNVYYDKPKGSHSQFSIIPAKSSSWDEARQAYQSEEYTNAQGVKEVDYCQLNGKNLDYSDAIDIHITSNDNPIIGGGTVNLGSDRTWLIFDNIVPSQVITSYLASVKIKGRTAQNGVNCRVAIYLNGAAVIPIPNVVMACEGSTGSFNLEVGNNKDLGGQSNKMTGFTLRRGYMATVASGTNGSGHSHVYVADHQDLEITLPAALNLRVSSVNIKPWQYLSKKGWADTAGSSKGPQLRATWYWSWSAGYNSTTDMEYVPCRQHLYWPSAAEVNNKTATASLSLNEPEHSEQHTSDKCSCGGTISEWNAYKLNSDFQAGGGRIGSPQPTDFSYLTNYCNYVDNNNNQSRCDFVVTHAYWNIGSRDANTYAKYVTDQCWTIWNDTGRPVWLTELECGASWSNYAAAITSYDKAREYLQALLMSLEESDYIERYAIYSFDFWRNKLFYDDGGITPAGQVYRDHRSTFAYHADRTKEPAWWAPGVKDPTLDFRANDDGTVTFMIGNTNGDATELLTLERMVQGGNWKQFAVFNNRAVFDNSTIEHTVSLNEINRLTDTFRVTVTTLYGGSATSSETKMGYISNPNIETTSKDAVPGWTCERSASNGYTKDTGDTYFEVWSPTAENMGFNYYQDLNALPAGVYALKAVCFNSSNGVSGASVNGNVGLYALAENVEYFAPVTDDTEIDYNRETVIEKIVVRNGKMRIGIKNQGTMTARWAGADNFELTYLGTEEEVLDGKGDQFIANANDKRKEQLLAIATDDETGGKNFSMLIKNTDCLRADFYGWTTVNLGTEKGQAWDGDANNNYFDKWNSGSLESSMTQTVNYLPAGDFTLNALMRCTTGQTVTLRAVHQSKSGEQTVYEKSITGIGDTSVDGSPYQRGWQKVTLPTFTAQSGDQLIISATISADVTAWWSVDHFTLIWNETAPEVCTITLAKEMETFANSKPIDFTSLNSGLKAYTVSDVEGAYAILSEVTGAVPAGTGLILMGTAGETYEIPYAVEEPKAIGNMLKGVLTDTKIGGNDLDYVLKDGKFVKAEAGTLKAGKAYLRLETALARDIIEIGSETTNISEKITVNSKEAAPAIYNLKGTRVSQPTKGIYIQKNKKMVVR